MWTEKEQDLLERFNAKFPAPKDDDNCRMWTLKLAEQFAFTFPVAGWGTKSAGNGRPPSTDVICTRSPFVGFDVLVDQGLPSQKLAYYPAPLNLTGQTYISVTPHDYLGAVTPPQTPKPPTYPYPDENTAGKAFQERVRKAYSDAGRAFPDPNDQDAFRHFQRYGYSAHEMPEPQAADKHIAELRAQLGV